MQRIMIWSMLIILLLSSCGTPESSGTGNATEPWFKPVIQPTDRPYTPIPTYNPERHGDIVIIDIAQPRPIEFIDLKVGDTVIFQHPPTNVPIDPQGWWLEYKGEFFTRYIDGVAQVYDPSQSIIGTYPKDGWTFKATKTGIAIIGVHNDDRTPPTCLTNQQCFADSWLRIYNFTITD